MRPGADPTAVIWPRTCHDGDEILVPAQGVAPRRAPAITGRRSAPAFARPRHPPRPAPAARVDINRAELRRWASVPGSGRPRRAHRRVSGANGPFASADELLDVSGITDRRLDAIAAVRRRTVSAALARCSARRKGAHARCGLAGGADGGDGPAGCGVPPRDDRITAVERARRQYFGPYKYSPLSISHQDRRARARLRVALGDDASIVHDPAGRDQPACRGAAYPHDLGSLRRLHLAELTHRSKVHVTRARDRSLSYVAQTFPHTQQGYLARLHCAAGCRRGMPSRRSIRPRTRRVATMTTTTWPRTAWSSRSTAG